MLFVSLIFDFNKVSLLKSKILTSLYPKLFVSFIEDFNGKEGILLSYAKEKIKASHTKQKIITLFPSKPSSKR